MENQTNQNPIPEPIQSIQSVQPAQPVKNNNFLVIILSIFLLVTVGLAFFFYFQTQKFSKELSKYQTQPSPTPTATADPTADWKTYTNEKYRFKFKHPNNWVLQTVDMRSDNQYFLLDTLNQLTPIDILVDVTSDKEEEINKDLSNYEVDKLPAYRKINKNSQGDITQEITYFKHGNYTYTIVATYENKFDQKLQNIYDQILSTFKFLDQPSAEGKFCGGIAFNLPENQCPEGFYCKLDGNYPDAGGVCTKK